MKTLMLVLLSLAACGGDPKPLRCAGTRPMWCHCVYACTATDTQVIVEWDGVCEPLCVGDGGT